MDIKSAAILVAYNNFTILDHSRSIYEGPSLTKNPAYSLQQETIAVCRQNSISDKNLFAVYLFAQNIHNTLLNTDESAHTMMYDILEGKKSSLGMTVLQITQMNYIIDASKCLTSCSKPSSVIEAQNITTIKRKIETIENVLEQKSQITDEQRYDLDERCEQIESFKTGKHFGFNVVLLPTKSITPQELLSRRAR